jgi:hypothetical protein
MNGWTFIFMMVVLKIPVVALLWIVWWAVHQTPDEPGTQGGEGGSRRRRHPRGPLPRTPRRGPHGGAPSPAPQRTRAVVDLPARRLTRP